MHLQKLVPIRQKFENHGLADVAAAVRGTMESAPWTSSVAPGSRIAVGVGSRGIANIALITKAVVDFWRSRRMKPFLVPVMGSHGSASAAGQAAVLAHLGITAETMGVPVVSSLDVVKVGTTPEGIDVSMDRNAYEADGVMLVSRVKWHTNFEGKLESGVHKMMAIGLGKWEGAKRYHVFGQRIGLEQVIRSVGRVMIETRRILGGLAILEDAYHQTAEVHAIGAGEMAVREEQLLERVKQWKAAIPLRELDLLIVDEIGKNISGAGMDTKVVNRGGIDRNTLPDVVKIVRIYARDLTEESGGNAIGIGRCDVISDRLFHKIDFESTWLNAFTASHPVVASCPPHFPNDRMAIEKLIMTCGKLDPHECSIAQIRNTMKLDEILVSENLLDELRGNSPIEIVGPAAELQYDAVGDLAPLGASFR